MVDIKWFGHACFGITMEDGTTIAIDPFDKKEVGYENPDVEADVALISHDHYDHNKIENIKGTPEVLRWPGEHTSCGISFRGVITYHDDVSGSERGANTVFTFTVDGIRICHLGDLGHILNEQKINEIGEVDVLLIPVGGASTIDCDQADEVIEQLNPRIVIPMHYKTPPLKLPLDPVQKFLRNKENVEYLHGTTISVSKDDLPDEMKIVVLDYK
jgi:L-ascorbate metabolism protein UlaG (beta-lactamase superfamily)